MGLFGRTKRTAAPLEPIGTVRKDFVRGGLKYVQGDGFPKNGQDRPTMIELRGLVAAQLITPDKIPGPGEAVGEGKPNPYAIPRRADA